jgi:predicted AlkP superfamily phosphohydrolase/phosphomutase
VCGEILDGLDDRTTVLCMSDHGGGSINRYFWINRWLFQEGFLRLKGDSFTQREFTFSRVRLDDVMKRIGWGGVPSRIGGAKVLVPRWRRYDEERLIDWDRTRAYGNWRGVGESINLNVRGREPRGVVGNGDEGEQLRQELTERLLALRDPGTGEPVIRKVLRKEELYSGPFAHEAPDLYLIPYNERCSLRREYQPGPVFTTPIAAHGVHRREGILFLAGPNVRAGVPLERATLADVAPTLLHLMGLKIPEDMDGEVLVGVIQEEHLRSHPIQFRPPVPWEPKRTVTYTTEEVVRLEDALRGLGYVD